MYIFKTKAFCKWAEDEGLPDELLKLAVNEIEQGLVDAKLGGNLYKKRIATSSKGKSGGFRTLLAFKMDETAFFLYGFTKRQRANVSGKELKALKLLAREMFGLNDYQLKLAVDVGELIEVKVSDDE
jgi:hypothetical protein